MRDLPNEPMTAAAVKHIDAPDREEVERPVMPPLEETAEEKRGYQRLSDEDNRPRMDFDQFVSDGNYIETILGAFWGFVHSDWNGAYRRHGVGGVIVEFFRFVTSSNIATIQVDRYSIWSGWAQEKMLKRHGIHLWDRRLVDHGRAWEYSIKARRLNWAHYILLRAGVPVLSEVSEKTRVAAERFMERQRMETDHLSWFGKLFGFAPTPAHSEPPNFSQQRDGLIAERKRKRDIEREVQREYDRNRSR